MNRRTRRLETAIVIAHLVASEAASKRRLHRTGKPRYEAISAFTIADALDKVQRAATRLQRIHEGECNGDHERCLSCGGDDRRREKCERCGGSGRCTDEETRLYLANRDRVERGIEKRLRDLGLVVAIDRDPRSGPVLIFERENEVERGTPRVVFPIEGF